MKRVILMILVVISTSIISYTPSLGFAIESINIENSREYRKVYEQLTKIRSYNVYLDNDTTFKQCVVKLIEISHKLKIEPSWLINSILKESRFNPKARNVFTNATGLIQWLPSTARYLGTTIEEISEMTIIEQLDLTYKYINKFNKTELLDSYVDFYLIILQPVAVGKGNSYVIGYKYSDYKTRRKIYEYNYALDHNKDSKITIKEISYFINSNTI